MVFTVFKLYSNDLLAENMTLTDFTSQIICLFTSLLHRHCDVFLRYFTMLLSRS